MYFFAFVLTYFATYSHTTVVNATPVTIGNETYSSQRALIDSGKRCGMKEPSPAQIAETNKIVNQWLRVNGGGTLRTSTQPVTTTTKTVNTYFHVITAGSTGVISAPKLRAQFTIFKNELAKYGFNFVLKNTTFTNNEAWYYSGIESAAETQMKRRLKVGGADTLNVYFAYCSGYLGYAYFPVKNVSLYDGACIYSESVPGGAAVPYDQGKTLIHEVGHWLGLYHTFPQDSVGTDAQLCNQIGDHIADTPRMATPTSGCPIGRDSCPNNPGKDPINNYMDYSDDACYTSFTPCQTNRMHAMWEKYRA